jgi:hypothetical protein
MSRDISMFTATADLEVALTILAQTALGLSREVRRAPLAQCRERLSTEDANRALRRLATVLSVDASRLPPADSIAQMFDDELLSMKALKLHRGRNVYSAGKLALWESLWAPFRQALSPDPATLSLLAELVAWQTVQGHPDLTRCADALTARLTSLGFDVQRVERSGHAPLLVARRAARNLAGRLVMYGHYDAAETDPAAWASDPWTLTERDRRLYGCAVGDNKAAVAQRLVTLAGLDESPEIVWILQGEEECESPLAHEVLPEVLHGLDATLWLEENGYFDPNGTQRMLARVIGPVGESQTPDAALDQIVRTLGDDAATWGSAHRLEVRGLNKDFFARGCPFNRALPPGARYLAIGVNDPASTIHRPNESVPVWTLALHAKQFATVLREVDRIARER